MAAGRAGTPAMGVRAKREASGWPGYQLVCRTFHSLCGFVHMVDEVRRLDAGRHLGIGTIGFTGAQRRVPLPFLLSGPIDPYLDDLGEERAGFDVASDRPALAR